MCTLKVGDRNSYEGQEGNLKPQRAGSRLRPSAGSGAGQGRASAAQLRLSKVTCSMLPDSVFSWEAQNLDLKRILNLGYQLKLSLIKIKNRLCGSQKTCLCTQFGICFTCL